jgi:hypothetical protein
VKISRLLFVVSLSLAAAAPRLATPAHAAVAPPPPPKPPAEGRTDPAEDATVNAAAAEFKPAEVPAPRTAEAPANALPDFQTWLRGLSLPAWLTDSGLPLWAWVPLAFLGFALLRGLFRGGDQRDLIGPPPSMRLGARANPPAPRRADPPQRG